MVIRRNRLVVVVALVALVWGAPQRPRPGKDTGRRDTTGAALPASPSRHESGHDRSETGPPAMTALALSVARAPTTSP